MRKKEKSNELASFGRAIRDCGRMTGRNRITSRLPTTHPESRDMLGIDELADVIRSTARSHSRYSFCQVPHSLSCYTLSRTGV